MNQDKNYLKITSPDNQALYLIVKNNQLMEIEPTKMSAGITYPIVEKYKEKGLSAKFSFNPEKNMIIRTGIRDMEGLLNIGKPTLAQGITEHMKKQIIIDTENRLAVLSGDDPNYQKLNELLTQFKDKKTAYSAN